MLITEYKDFHQAFIISTINSQNYLILTRFDLSDIDFNVNNDLTAKPKMMPLI